MSGVVTGPAVGVVVISPTAGGVAVVGQPASTAAIPAAAIGVPGNPGPQGAPGVDATVLTLATAATVAYAAQPSASTPGEVQAATNFAVDRFAGVFTASALAGTTQPVQHAGPVSPLTLSLGAGVACAVGCTATGAPCRVTDVACVSGLNFLGWCDAAGVVNVAPRVAEAYNIVDFGAVPNDSGATARAANTAAFKAIQAMLGTSPAAPYSTRGGAIYASGDDYYFAADAANVGGTGAGVACIHLTNPVTVQGSGSRYVPGTRFFFPSGVIGVQTHHPGASGAKIDGCYLSGEGAKTVTTAHGVDMLTATQISNCVVSGFGGHGIYWNPNGFPDYCKISYTYCTDNLDGVHISAGGDTNGGGLYMVDCQLNRGWGFYDYSFLGTHMDNCTAAENMRGPCDFSSTAGGTVIGLYTESDQPPGRSVGACRYMLGGTGAAGMSPSSQFFGGANGYAQMHAAGFVGSPNVPECVATGTAPEQVTLGGTLTAAAVNIRIEVTTAGYPGGKDSFHASQTALVIRYSLNGGSTWTSNISPPRADDGYNYGLGAVALGASGLTAYFVPYFYPLDSVYTTTGSGGVLTQTFVGSSDGTMSVLGWGHLLAGPANTDPAPFRTIYDVTTGLWQFKWANAYSGFAFAGGRARPFPGEVAHASSLWVGRDYDGFFRMAKANGDNAVGSSAWRSTTLSTVHVFAAGDVVFNTGTTTRFPAAWRAKRPGGWAITAAGQDTVWSAGIGMLPGHSVTPSTPNGYVYQCKTYTGSGVTGDTEPTWPTTPGATVADADITWECVGLVGNPFESLTAVETYTPTSSADAHGTEGDTCQDASYFYYKSASGWRRCTGGTF